MNTPTPSPSSSLATSVPVSASVAEHPARRPGFRRAARRLRVLVMGVAGAGLASSLHAATDAWDGSTDSLWATATNWATDVSAPGAGETATFNGAGGGNTMIDLGAGAMIGSVVFDTSSAAAYVIGAGAAGSQALALGNAGAITINAGVTTNQTFNSAVQLGNAAAATATITHNGAGLLSFAGAINANVASGNGLLAVAGSGNISVSGAVTRTGAGSNALLKTGAGTLTLSNGSVWSGAGASNGQTTSAAVVREGVLRLAGGAHAVTGELVVGGVVSNGGAGQNARVQVDAGSLAVSDWLSIGRGNGVGAVSSEVVLNNAATLTTLNLSAGYNANSTLNLPKGSITLNGSSALTATSASANASNFIIGESNGSDFTLTINDSATVSKTGGSVALANQTNAGVQIGKNAGKGAVIMNGGVFNASSVDVGRGSNNTQAANGTLTIRTGAVFNSEGDFRTGFAGSGASRATVNLEGGALNIGSVSKRWMVIGTWDSTQSTINVTSGGNLNLNTNTDIRFGQENNVGPNVINLEAGGAITSYSDNKTTALGSGVVDLMLKGAATSNNTFNLNGGTLAVRQVLSSTNNGTRTFNFNGGTLRATGATAALLSLGSGSARANVRDGGARIDTNGFAVTLPQALLHSNVGGDNATDGGLVKSGAGTLTLSGANTYTGGTTIGAGTLVLGAGGSLASPRYAIAEGATLDASAFASYSLPSGGVTIGLGETGSGRFNAGTGALALGGPLTLDFASSVSAPSASAYNLFDYASRSGNFSSVSIAGRYALGLVRGGDVWSGAGGGYLFSFSELTGDLTVSAIPEPSAFAALAGLAGLGLAVARRRRR